MSVLRFERRAWARLVLIATVSTTTAPVYADAPKAKTARTKVVAGTHAVELDAAAHHKRGAPSAVVHIPQGFDASAPLHLVVFLHGYKGCAQVLAASGTARCRKGDAEREGWGLAAQHDAANTNTLFVVPQLAYMRRDADPGCFAKQGCFRRFVQELLADALVPYLGRPRTLTDLASITFVAHSAGFRAALAVLERGEVDAHVRAVVLMDALYADEARFARWLQASPRARLASIHLGRGDTARRSRALARRLRRTLGAEQVAEVEEAQLADALGKRRVVVTRGRGAHRLVPAHYLALVLRSLKLPSR
jgi:hypothetical protein